MTELAKKRPEFRNINALVDLPTSQGASVAKELGRYGSLPQFLSHYQCRGESFSHN